MLVPFAIQADGHPLQTAAWCVSIAGVCNLFTRMTVSSLSVHPAWQTGEMSVWGCTAAVFYGINNLLMMDVVGLSRLTAIYSAKNLLGALGFFSVGPLVGELSFHNTD